MTEEKKSRKAKTTRETINKANIDAREGTDFESALVVTLFGVGYSLMFRLFQGETTFFNLIKLEYLLQLLVTVVLITVLPLVIIGGYIYFIRKGIIRSLDKNARFWKFVTLLLLKIAAIVGAPYGFFYLTMMFLQVSTVGIVEIRPEYVWTPLPYLVGWAALFVIYLAWQYKHRAPHGDQN